MRAGPDGHCLMRPPTGAAGRSGEAGSDAVSPTIKMYELRPAQPCSVCVALAGHPPKNFQPFQDFDSSRLSADSIGWEHFPLLTLYFGRNK